MLFREMTVVYCKACMKETNTLLGQNLEFLNVKLGGTYSNHWALPIWLLYWNLGAAILKLSRNTCYPDRGLPRGLPQFLIKKFYFSGSIRPRSLLSKSFFQFMTHR
jgi:hypothetical protein